MQKNFFETERAQKRKRFSLLIYLFLNSVFTEIAEIKKAF